MQRLVVPPGRGALALAAALVAVVMAACSCSGSDALAPDSTGGHAGAGGADAGGAGAGTTSSTETTSGSGVGGGDDWLHDAELWEPIVADVPCDVYAAKLPSDEVPRRTWMPCGDGCLWAPAPLSGQDLAVHVTASEIGGEIYYRVSSGIIGDKNAAGVDEVARLSDDEAVNLLRHRNDCMALSGFDSPLLFFLHPLVAPGTEPLPPAYVGVVSAPGAPVVWGMPGFDMPSGLNLFDFGGGWGFIASTSMVKVATTPGSSALQTIFSSQGYALRPVGRGQQVVWSDWSDYDSQSHRARVRSWTEAGGTVELAGGPYDVMYIALSDTKMVWIGGYGVASVEGNTESEQLFWSPRATAPADVVIHDGPVVPDTEATTSHLVTYGDWVATITNNFQEHNAVVVNLATDQIWSIPARPGKRFAEVMAINATSLLIDERDAVATQYPESIVRLDLTKLDTLVQGLQ